MISLRSRPTAPLTIVTLCRATTSSVSRFVHLSIKLGAQRVIIFHDIRQGEQFSAARFRNGLPVEEIACTDTFWRDNGAKNPTNMNVERKQKICYDYAYSTIEPGHWVAFCDVDEVFVPQTSFNDIFNQAGNNDQITADTCEVMFRQGHQPSDFRSWTVGRRPIRQPAVLATTLNERSPLFRNVTRFGLVGHAAGKSIVRSGIDNFSAGIHAHFKLEHEKRVSLTTTHAPVDLLHYDGFSLEDWEAKHYMRSRGTAKIGAPMDHRLAQSEIVELCSSQADRWKFHSLLYSASDSYCKALNDAYSLEEIIDLGNPSFAKDLQSES